MRAVLCLGDLKEAAIYFDRALPLLFNRMRGTGKGIVFECPDEVPLRALIDLTLGEGGFSENRKYALFGEMWKPWETFITVSGKFVAEAADAAGLDFSQPHPFDPEVYKLYLEFLSETLPALYLKNAISPQYGSIREHVARFAGAYGLQCADLLLGASSERSPIPSGDSEPLFTVAGLPLVDVSEISWDQIIELRQDRVARRKLQRLRAFLVENYINKSPAFIEDDLGRRIDDYELTARKHGFALRNGAFSVLLESKNVHAAIAAGLGAALFGGSLAGLGTAAVVELGKVALEVSKRNRELRDWRTSHELAYLIDLRIAASKD